MDKALSTMAVPIGRARPALLIASTVFAFALVGCASPEQPASQPPAATTEGPGPEETAPEETAPEESVPEDVESGSSTDPDEGGTGVGTITVDTTTYKVLDSVNCMPDSSSEVLTRVFEVIAVAQSADGGEALFFGYTDEQSGVPAYFVDYQGPEGTWGTPDGDAHFSIDGDTLSGAGVLIDDANTQSIMVQFEFTLPDELVEC